MSQTTRLFHRVSFKLSMSYAVLVVSLVVVGYTGYSAAKIISGNLEMLFVRFLPSVDFLIEADRDLHQLLVAERTMLFADVESDSFKKLQDVYALNLKQAKDRFASFKALTTTPEEKQLAEQFEQAMRQWEATSAKVVQGRLRNTEEARAAAMALSQGQANEQFEFMREFINKLTDIELGYSKEKNSASKALYENTVLVIAGLTGAMVLFAALTGYLIVRGLLRQLGGEPDEIASIARQVAVGDLSLTFHENAHPQSIYAAMHAMVRSSTLVAETVAKLALGDLNVSSAERSDKDVLMRSLGQLIQAEKDIAAMAGKLANKASTHLSKGGLAGKSALCDLVRARVRLRSGKVLEARALCQGVLNVPPQERLPSIDYLAWFTLGEVEEHQGHWMQAWDAWQKTREAVDRLRNSLGGEDLRISFLKDKVEVYENLIWLWMSHVSGSGVGPTPREVLALLQEAKSRSLADLLDTASPEGLRPASDPASGLRLELASLYRRIESAMLGSNASESEIRNLTRQARDTEDKLTQRLGEQRRALNPSKGERRHILPGAFVSAAHDVQPAMPKDSQLVEFFAVRGRYVAALVSQRRIEFVELGPIDTVAEKVRLARFQLSKFRLGKDYLERFAPRLRDAIQTHFRGLYEELFRPLRKKLREEHLVIAPYGILHQLPFHALHDGDCCLIDEFTMSYAPSGGVLAACLRRPVSQARGNLVFGIADARSPSIEIEARAVAGLLDSSELFLTEEATEERLRLAAPQTRILHIATHGFFRRDNPLFSAIRLGDGFLSLFDLYRLDLRADLVTLSGCSTGLSTVVGGDELLGLTRGLLHAGARAVLLSLWDVQDESTAEYMTAFYRLMSEGQTAATASQSALRNLRNKYDHPYYWAPFCLVGDWKVSTLAPNAH